ncbi:kinase-like domain-containing protein [Lophiotrema nucula]|uniref:Kinase-like domain-containing protein n=1 Tax=Lophiotrema nucula TaxID=690887 RepID=A0A6A5YHM5_9PLEO|nr:kinase-like domain-containing protein [Lophiotrema nucula]
MINIDEYKYWPGVESLAAYADGGLCPIHINDKLQGGRYQIINKLGFGGYSTVWAALDHDDQCLVSIKVVKAQYSENNIELRILEHLRDGQKPVFIVTELLGPSTREFGKRFGLSAKIPKQLLLAVDYLHQQDIVHGDVHEGNVLFRIPEGFERDLEEIEQYEVTRKDGRPLEEGIPRMLVVPHDFDLELDDEEFESFNHIQLIDFSSSFFMSNPPKTTHTVLDVSPPELVFCKSLDKKMDIWSLACTVYYLVAGDWPFDARDDRRNIIPQIHRVLGEADWLLAAFEDTVYEGKWDDLPQLRFSNYRDYCSLEGMLETHHISQESGPNTKRNAAAAVISFLRRGLTVDPSNRPTTVELLKEEWMSEGLKASK